jgi:predicted TIM-barrel fold metal-dependent hydrolase
MVEQRDRVARVIAIEEHAWTPAIREALLDLGGDETTANWSNEETCNRRLLDVGDERLERMEAMGVDFQVLSITAPGVQQLPSQLAISLAAEANDFLAAAVQRRPDSFAAFATLPTQAPEVAADELRRCVSDMGFVGAMLFPRTGPLYLDHESFRPIFAAAAELEVPLYIHPGLPLDVVRQACYSGFSPATNLMLATGGWGWHAEAGLAALRLILAGTFERHPELQLILGHMGEMLISFADRADALTKTTGFERSVLDCITGNFYATPGGVFSHRMLRQVLDVLGPDRVMFAVDDPYKGTLGQQGKATFGGGFCREFIETAPITFEEKSKLAHLNAERLLFDRA